MSTAFYLPRRLNDSVKLYTEEELLAASNFVVVLAEPGGGKTELMGSLAQQLGTKAVTASKFANVEARANNIPLVIDAFDELSKVDNSGIYKLLGKAEATNPTHVYVSSRSSEWDIAATSAVKDFFGHTPLVVRLCEFDEAEQRAIFDYHLPGEEFAAFQAEVARFDLKALLPNPQFLKLFANAYIESGGSFIDKRSIFTQAVERLTKEVNPNVASIKPPLSIARKVDISSEVFTKLLLSGAEGVCTSEAMENRMYPLLASLFENEAGVNCILATRLYKPSDSVGQHRPVHKIVAEYCAADYLTKRIADPADPLTLPKCLPIIAPSSTVRDDLRGLLGWMAALGNRPIQESAIELDPYAVLANGDPSQLDHSSKRMLISRLKEVESEDPYFRRGDFWRRFSIAGFFTQDVVDEIKPLLASGSNGHLRDLILELLRDSSVIEQLRDELKEITLMPRESDHARVLASRCLLGSDGHDHHSDLSVLISEASNTSLRIAAEIIQSLGTESFELAYLAKFLGICKDLYPGRRERHGHAIGDRYFLNKFIHGLDLLSIEWLLDDLTKDLGCTCGKNPYACDCRNGISKIVGLMLDRYFELASPPFDPLRVWAWVENLNFHEQRDSSQSKAVQLLQNDNALRQGIISHVFGSLADLDEIRKTRFYKFDLDSHSGLVLRAHDIRFIVDFAFSTNNLGLWSFFMPSHHFYRNVEQQGPHELRRHMREQALVKPQFLREWVKKNRMAAQQFERETCLRARARWSGKRRRRSLSQNARINRANIEYFQTNRKRIESGRHWNSLAFFAQLTLMHPDQIETRVGDEELVRCALRNCLDFIAPKVPDLLGLAELSCGQKSQQSMMILYASCLEIMSSKGSLEDVDLRILKALRTNCSVAYGAVSHEQSRALVAEIDRLVFPDGISAESFLLQYLEPQLAVPGCNCHDLQLLSEDVFSRFRPLLSIEWLKRFPGLALSSLDRLFEIAAQYGNQDHLKDVIAAHCDVFISDLPYITEDKDIESKRLFWFIRAFFFLDDVPEACWRWLQIDKDTLLVFSEIYGQMHRDHYFYWPKLLSSKVEDILNAFIGKWPKVVLPGSWGTDSPKEEKAYRFFTEMIWSTDSGEPDDAIPILERLLADSRFADLHDIMRTIYASQIRKKALGDFEPPSPQQIVALLDHNAVVTVEGLRHLVIQELEDFQREIDGGEFNSADRFY